MTEYANGRAVSARSHWTPLRPTRRSRSTRSSPFACRGPRPGSGSTRSRARAGSSSGGSDAPGRSCSGRSTSSPTGSARGRSSRGLYDAARPALLRAGGRARRAVGGGSRRARPAPAGLARRRPALVVPDGRLARPRARPFPRTAWTGAASSSSGTWSSARASTPSSTRSRSSARADRRRARRDRQRARARAAQGSGSGARRSADRVRFHGFVADHREVERAARGGVDRGRAVRPERGDVHAARRPREAQGLSRRGAADRPHRRAAERAASLRDEAGAELVPYDAGGDRRRDRGAGSRHPSAGASAERRRSPTCADSTGRRAARGRAREARPARGLTPTAIDRRSRSATITSDGDMSGSARPAPMPLRRLRGTPRARRASSRRARRSRRGPPAAPCARGARGTGRSR